MLGVTILLSILAGAALPPLIRTAGATRTLGIARLVSARCALARAQAAVRHASVGLLLTARADGVWLSTFRDANGNGVRTDDINAGIDPPVDGAFALNTGLPGLVVAIGSPDTPMELGDHVLLSFSASGTSSSTSVYLTGHDGTRYAVRLLGVTGRVRIQRQDARTGQWRDDL